MEYMVIVDSKDGSTPLRVPIDEFVPIDYLSQHQFDRFMENRGGCRCHLRPPCHACVEPPTIDELEMISGISVIEIGGPTKKGYEPDSFRSGEDIMSITRGIV